MTQSFESWIGREERRDDQIHASAVAAMAATLDLKTAPAEGAPLPPGWHWLFFNPSARRSELGADGHPARGGFLPPVQLPRRMWAGSRIRYLADLPVGAHASRLSRILKVESKTGKRGALCFVTVEHTITHNGVACIIEEQDIVYREATSPATSPMPMPEVHPAQPQWHRVVDADSVLLFRYSALTFNGHRIHYDFPYAHDEEGYPGLVVHGPLTATLLQMFAQEHGNGRLLADFDFRGVAPLFAGRSFQLEACEEGNDRLSLWVRGPDGELAMSASAVFR